MGKNTVGFVSGDRASPQDKCDPAPWGTANYLTALNGVFQPGVNAELAATATWRARQLDAYRCKYGIVHTAELADNSVTLDRSRGSTFCLKTSKASASPACPNTTPVEYGSPRVNATFNRGVTGREAVLRYPLLALVSRWVRG